MTRSVKTLGTLLIVLGVVSLLWACGGGGGGGGSSETASNVTTTSTTPTTSTTTTSSVTTTTLSSETSSIEGDIACTTSIASDVPDWIKNNFICITATVSGSNIIIQTDDLPNYKNFYWGQGHANFTNDMPSGNNPNPNTISAQGYTLTIPLNPVENATATASGFGPVGVSRNSVVFYNNQAAPGDTLADEISTFNSANGHPTDTGSYHYHIEPPKITNNDANLVGIMLDGFPVYGKKDEDDTTPTNLDDAHGHNHATTLFPNGIWHYHVTDADPYIIEFYRGTPGTQSQ